MGRIFDRGSRGGGREYEALERVTERVEDRGE